MEGLGHPRLHPVGCHPCPPRGDNDKHTENPPPLQTPGSPPGIQGLQSSFKRTPSTELGYPEPSQPLHQQINTIPEKNSSAIPSSSPGTRIPARHTYVHTQTPSRHSCIQAASTHSGTIPSVSRTTFSLLSMIPCLPSLPVAPRRAAAASPGAGRLAVVPSCN